MALLTLTGTAFAQAGAGGAGAGAGGGQSNTNMKGTAGNTASGSTTAVESSKQTPDAATNSQVSPGTSTTR